MEQRQPELNDARTRIQMAMNDRSDPKRMLTAVQRVVSYMTMGADMSALFAEMAMACNTRDLAQKRLVYMYLSSYAVRNPDLALLTVNTLHKDCTDASPMVRGMALRALSSLRAANLVEYVFPLVQRGLTDPNSYVRRTAAIATAKLFMLAPRIFEKGVSNVVSQLEDMTLGDTDAQVSLNAAMALQETGRQPPRDAVLRLLSRVRDLGDWAQCQVLEMAARLRDLSQSEVIDIMNLLDDKLQHSNSAVVMATAKVFVQLTEPYPDIHRQVYTRIKTPILLLVEAAGSPEIVYPLLQHLKLCLTRFPDLLENEAKHFFIRASDPVWLRLLKIDLLTLVSTNDNSGIVLDELCVYVSDVEPVCARRAMEAIGKIGIKLPTVLSQVATRLANLVGLDNDAVTASSLFVIKDLLRKYPEVAPDVVPTVIKQALSSGALDDDPEAKAAAIWVLGEHGVATYEGAAYVLDGTLDSWPELPPCVKLATLTATAKMFFASPAEARPALGRALELATGADESTDVRDRAWLYYRLLKEDVALAERVIAPKMPSVSSFAEDEKLEVQDRLFEEFNTLAVAFEAPSETFVRPEKKAEEPDSSSAAPAPQQKPPAAARAAPAAATAPGSSSPPKSVDLLSTVAVPSALRQMALVRGVTMPPAEFQKSWAALPVGAKVEQTMEMSAEDLVAAFKGNTLNIACMASGVVANTAKVYAYAQDERTKAFVLLEVLAKVPARTLAITTKSADADAAAQFLSLVQESVLKGSAHRLSMI
eukprot:m51a1_g6365 Adaptor protein complex 4 (AP-4), beta subunit (762) ;mRNA; f:113676-116347